MNTNKLARVRAMGITHMYAWGKYNNVMGGSQSHCGVMSVKFGHTTHCLFKLEEGPNGEGLRLPSWHKLGFRGWGQGLSGLNCLEWEPVMWGLSPTRLTGAWGRGGLCKCVAWANKSNGNQPGTAGSVKAMFTWGTPQAPGNGVGAGKSGQMSVKAKMGVCHHCPPNGNGEGGGGNQPQPPPNNRQHGREPNEQL